jgi:small-conductance mechanosensitive channel
MRFVMRADAAVRGDFVALCPRHGRAALGLRPQRFDKRDPSWLLPLAYVSVLLAFVASKPIVVSLPYCDRCISDRRNARIVVLALWCALVVLFVPAAANSSGDDAFVVGWFIAMVAVVVLTVVLPRRSVPRGWVSNDGRDLYLVNTDEGFVRAMAVTSRASR